MASTFDCSDETELLTGMRLARAALGRGELAVIPTDTVYGIAADAFNPEAVTALLAAKGRDRQSPPPVLIPGLPTLDALCEVVPDVVRTLVDAFWPGGLTIVLPAQRSLVWDLGETRGTVALRMPDDTIALQLLEETGPLAVSSANLTGQTPAATAAEAEEMLGDSIEVYLEAGPRPATRDEDAGPEPSSTIVDATAVADGSGVLRILRHGAISEERLREVVGEELLPFEAEAGATEDAAPDDLAPEESVSEDSAPEESVPEDPALEAAALEDPAPEDAAPAVSAAADAETEDAVDS